MSLFVCAASSNHRGQWCLTSPQERTRWRHDSVCLVCRENSWKVTTFVQGWENPMSLRWLRTEDLKDRPFTPLCTGVSPLQSSFGPSLPPLGLRSSHLTPSYWGCLSSLSPQPFLPTLQAVTGWLSPRFPCGTHSHTSWVCWSPPEWLIVPIWNCIFFFEGGHLNATVNQELYWVSKAMMYGTLWCRKSKYALWVYTSLLHRNTVFIKQML